MRKHIHPADNYPAELKGFSLLENSNTPSWSWAANAGLVETSKWRRPDCDFQELAVVKKVAAELVSETYPTGSVLGGTIVLRGLCQQFLFSSKDAVDPSSARRGRLDAATLTVLLPPNGKTELESTFDLASERNADGPALCLLMAKHNGYYTKSGGQRIYIEAQVYCLILRLLHAEIGEYKRVGVGVIRGRNILDGSTGWVERTVTVV